MPGPGRDAARVAGGVHFVGQLLVKRERLRRVPGMDRVDDRVAQRPHPQAAIKLEIGAHPAHAEIALEQRLQPGEARTDRVNRPAGFARQRHAIDGGGHLHPA